MLGSQYKSIVQVLPNEASKGVLAVRFVDGEEGGGKRIASGGWDDLMKVWDIDSGEIVWDVDSGEVVWDVDSGEIVRGLTGNMGNSRVFSAAIAPGGTAFASASYDASLRVWKDTM
ncbi:hypothetical protein T484DRAFT_1825463 [Baffinella frigidus]|nr:hypothetical protein T484DRAFT_1825463 [Cryptophyta sp. CCMP2293]